MGSYAAAGTNAGHVDRPNTRRADGHNRTMTPCLLLAVFGGLIAAVPGEGFRDRFLRALVLFGVALIVITESLGAFDLIRRGPLILCWSTVLLIALISARRRRFIFRFSPTPDPIV